MPNGQKFHTVYIVVFIFLARFFLCACPLPPPDNTRLGPDCDGERGDHFILFFSSPAVPRQPRGEGAIGLPTTPYLDAIRFARAHNSDEILCNDRLAVLI